MKQFKQIFGGKSLEESVEKSRGGAFSALRDLFKPGVRLDEDFWEELEATLIMADVGPYLAVELIESARERIANSNLDSAAEAHGLIEELLVAELGADSAAMLSVQPLTVILMIGVNGAGKTTMTAKLAYWLQEQGHSCMLAAADTFRAAAIDQLRVWADRIDVPIIAQQPGSDPGAVVFDAIDSALARNVTHLIVDTAGRLHTKANLMDELRKVQRIAANRVDASAIETLLVIDAITGQNALNQAKVFRDAIPVTGVVLTKLDSTARGGSVFSIARELQLPIKLVGTGEQLNDMDAFDGRRFVRALLNESVPT
ncbi:MAG: signal recognition particle-docking protein FtsY [Chloroflexota bacterium]|nr:signal recognition particle-docking protein FtsY [Chloroflexota bacterium]MDE2930854.1 signal recognition particle-docking protein FtsY [Chloroflexota bacterium]